MEQQPGACEHASWTRPRPGPRSTALIPAGWPAASGPPRTAQDWATCPHRRPRIIEHRIRTGDYEPGTGGTGTRAAELARLCAGAGISAVTDPRSARISYSGLTWQIDCQNASGWVEVAGGGDYTDAAALLHWLRGHPSPAPPVRAAGSAAGIERLAATAAS